VSQEYNSVINGIIIGVQIYYKLYDCIKYFILKSIFKPLTDNNI